MGRMCSSEIRAEPLPATRAARMYSRFQSDSAAPRVRRAKTDIEDADGDDGVECRRPEDGSDHDRDQKAWKRKHKVIGAHDDLVHQAAFPGSSSKTERHTNSHADADSNQGDGNGCARTDHDHAENVPPKLIGSEEVQPAWRLHAVGDIQHCRVIRYPDEADERGGCEQKRQNGAWQQCAAVEQDAHQRRLRSLGSTQA